MLSDNQEWMNEELRKANAQLTEIRATLYGDAYLQRLSLVERVKTLESFKEQYHADREADMREKIRAEAFRKGQIAAFGLIGVSSIGTFFLFLANLYGIIGGGGG